MKAKLNGMETNYKLLMENEMMYINKILLLENKLISLKKKMKSKLPPKDSEPIFYLSNMHTSHDDMSDVSTLTISEIN